MLMSRIDLVSVLFVVAIWGYSCSNVPPIKAMWGLAERVAMALF